MAVLKNRPARKQLDGGPLLDQLADLRAAVAEARRAVTAAEAELSASGRWFTAAETELRRALEADAPADELAALRDRVTDLGATRVVLGQVGSSTRYGDTRAAATLEDAHAAAQEAETAVAAFVREHAEPLQRTMLVRSERARDTLLAAYAEASDAAAAWRRQRADWLSVAPLLGISPAELPPLLGDDPRQALDDALLAQHRAGGHARHPRLLVPAPVSIQLRDPADARTFTPGDTVPDEQRRTPREETS